ncbi:MAG: hypothetical protein EBY45_06230 [Gammaproteobacteria bacterium]|nr:hypothetical protein [Gammaproteobacteria bacterium]
MNCTVISANDFSALSWIVSRISPVQSAVSVRKSTLYRPFIFPILHLAAKAAPDNRLDCVLIDEAQFLSPAQVDQALATAVLDDTPVLAYGIRTDFQTRSFPGSQRLMEIAHALEEMKTICRCGKKAIFNARLKDGAVVREGSQVMIDGDDAEYEARCARCYLEG